ncbi:MAG: sulfotransferase family protein [Acidimicrobiia bacterium]
MSDRQASQGRATDPFAFVLGFVRSGTTMLRAMLDSHSTLAVPPESYFVVSLLQSSARLEKAAGLDWTTLLERVESDRYFRDWNLAPEALVALRTDDRVRTTADAVAGLYATYAATHGKARYGDKTPSNLGSVDLLARSFPGSRFVHIVRDGRDVVPSVVKMPFGPNGFAEAALSWERRVQEGRHAGLALGPKRYLEIHYESLVAEPETVLAQVCAHFDLEYEPTMLEYHARSDELLTGLRHTDHIQGIRKPPTPGLRDWRVDLSPYEIQLFESIAGNLLDELGYERSGLRPSSRARAEAAARRAASAVRRKSSIYTTRIARRVRRR